MDIIPPGTDQLGVHQTMPVVIAPAVSTDVSRVVMCASLLGVLDPEWSVGLGTLANAITTPS